MKLRARIFEALQAAGDPARAEKMRAYMKSDVPYAGVAMADAKRVFREAFSTYPDGIPSKKPFDDESRFLTDVRALWDGARVREERYAAIELLGCTRAKKLRTSRAIPLVEHIVVTGAWWDIIDAVAPSTLGPMLDSEPTVARPLIRAWAKSDNLWIRRSAIVAQLHRKSKTDTRLLDDTRCPSFGSKELFLAKKRSAGRSAITPRPTRASSGSTSPRTSPRWPRSRFAKPENTSASSGFRGACVLLVTILFAPKLHASARRLTDFSHASISTSFGTSSERALDYRARSSEARSASTRGRHTSRRSPESDTFSPDCFSRTSSRTSPNP